MTKKSNKIAALDTEYAKKKYVEFQEQQRQLIFRRRRLAVIFIGALVIFAILGFQIFRVIFWVRIILGLSYFRFGPFRFGFFLFRPLIF